MRERYYPDLYIGRVQDIDFGYLREKGIKGLILDIDNTLVPHGKEADENAVRWIERVRSEGASACIVSNASRKRVEKFNERLQLPTIHRASKPRVKAFLTAAGIMELKPDEIAVVGDQIFTDIRGGKKAGMFTILVKPIDKKELAFIKIKRLAELFVLAGYRKRIRKE